MKKLTEEVTVVKALLPDIRKYVVPAYTDMLESYRVMGRPLPKLKNDNNIRFSIPNNHNYWNSDFGYHFTQGMLEDFCNNLAHNLDLSDHESVKLGEAYHAHGIGNNKRIRSSLKLTTRKFTWGTSMQMMVCMARFTLR